MSNSSGLRIFMNLFNGNDAQQFRREAQPASCACGFASQLRCSGGPSRQTTRTFPTVKQSVAIRSLSLRLSHRMALHALLSCFASTSARGKNWRDDKRSCGRVKRRTLMKDARGGLIRWSGITVPIELTGHCPRGSRLWHGEPRLVPELAPTALPASSTP